ncbi:MAG: hypothetical protein WD716_03550 [Fimbriimonadaceae bacterium]
MRTEDLIPICEVAILELREIEIDYQHVSDPERRTRVVAPFDVGSGNPKFAERFKDNLYAFSADHVDEASGRVAPQVLVFAIRNVFSARILDTRFDPAECRLISLQHDNYDWKGAPFNLVPKRGWF